MASPIDTFFASFLSFSYDPRAPATSEFQKLRSHRGWGADSKKHRRARSRFFAAFEAEFNAVFGSGDTDWAYLCELLHVAVPSNITQARKVLSKIHVNIFDLLDYHKKVVRGETARLLTFPSVGLLHDYSAENGKIYPLEMAKQQGALKFMLRTFFKPGGAKKR